MGSKNVWCDWRSCAEVFCYVAGSSHFSHSRGLCFESLEDYIPTTDYSTLLCSEVLDETYHRWTPVLVQEAMKLISTNDGPLQLIIIRQNGKHINKAGFSHAFLNPQWQKVPSFHSKFGHQSVDSFVHGWLSTLQEMMLPGEMEEGISSGCIRNSKNISTKNHNLLMCSIQLLEEVWADSVSAVTSLR